MLEYALLHLGSEFAQFPVLAKTICAQAADNLVS
jgi:hypothetical protein